MIIQEILFPKKDCCTDWELYFRALPEVENPEEGIPVAKGQILSLETYFNAFSVGKWSAYTRIPDLSVRLLFSGEAEVVMMHATGHKDDDRMYEARTRQEKEAAMEVSWEKVPATTERTEDGCILHLNTLYSEGIVFPMLKAKSDDVIFCGGSWETSFPESEARPLRIACCICTFRREKELARNVAKLLAIMEDESHPMHGSLEVFISDNGQTLLPEDFDAPGVHLFKNRNYGGAGGFTRCMIESVFRYQGEPFSHVILMDDDIDFDPAVLLRTWHLLGLVRPEYERAYVGGAMMELEARYMQFEYGAAWKGLHLQSFNHEWDLRSRKAVSCNDEVNPVNYTGWWYCCIPAVTITPDNLPIPMFIHYDDIEYGARNSGPGVILINGMCVWHPYGENKQPISMYYYDERNIMIAMSGSGFREKPARIVDHIARILTREVMRYRYDGAEACFQGFEDFYKGPEYFLSLDPETNHKALSAGNYQFRDPEEDGIDLSEIRNRRYEEYPKYVPQLEILCHLLPSFKDVQVVTETDIGYGFLAKSVYLYDRGKQKGYLVTRNAKRACDCIAHFNRLVKTVLTDGERVMDEWAAAKSRYTSLAFWERYLGLDGEQEETGSL